MAQTESAKTADKSMPGMAGMRERILEEAARLFVLNGYLGISMREIAEACGLSKAGLYYHFTDKENLFLAILDENLAGLERCIIQTEQCSSSVREQVRYFVRTIFAHPSGEQRAIIRLASQEMGNISPQARAAFDRRYQEQFIGRLAGLLARGVESGELRSLDPRLAVWALLGLMYPFFNTGYSVSAAEMDHLVEFILSIFFDGAAQHDRTP